MHTAAPSFLSLLRRSFGGGLVKIHPYRHISWLFDEHPMPKVKGFVAITSIPALLGQMKNSVPR